jgi:hypothetical protein
MHANALYMNNLSTSSILGESNRKDSVMQLQQIIRDAVTMGAYDFYSMPSHEQNQLLDLALQAYEYDIEVILTQATNRVFAKALLSNDPNDMHVLMCRIRNAYIDHLGDNLDTLIMEESQRRLGSAA